MPDRVSFLFKPTGSKEREVKARQGVSCTKAAFSMPNINSWATCGYNSVHMWLTVTLTSPQFGHNTNTPHVYYSDT